MMDIRPYGKNFEYDCTFARPGSLQCCSLRQVKLG
jgi:hypothetical protein